MVARGTLCHTKTYSPYCFYDGPHRLSERDEVSLAALISGPTFGQCACDCPVRGYLLLETSARARARCAGWDGDRTGRANHMVDFIRGVM